eukprot:GHVU01071040.1.p1 GENE.GHVU01071040.1~~GHVU01071040.1.p1  ORF type:complete len:275 (-),score=22.90 GHVU01071040.1:208-1032(-)
MQSQTASGSTTGVGQGRQRAAPCTWTDAESQVAVREYVARREAFVDTSNAAAASATRNSAWAEVTELVNQTHTHAPFTVKQVSTRVGAIESSYKCKQAAYVRQRGLTVGGPPPLPPSFTEAETLMDALMGSTAAVTGERRPVETSSWPRPSTDDLVRRARAEDEAGQLMESPPAPATSGHVPPTSAAVESRRQLLGRSDVGGPTSAYAPVSGTRRGEPSSSSVGIPLLQTPSAAGVSEAAAAVDGPDVFSRINERLNRARRGSTGRWMVGPQDD